jgi:mannose-6-phosphate isomerase-like protein (cupin superfamily)
MPTFDAAESTDYDLHGATFSAFVRPADGSVELCAWKLTVPPNTAGMPHRPSREEVLLILEGHLTVTIDGATTQLGPGAVALVPAGAQFQVDTGADGGSAWVTTTPGLTATTADGATVTPPWAA